MPSRTKLAILGGAATGVLLLGVWIGRRSAKRGDLSGTGVAGVDYAIEMPQLAAKTLRQVRRAKEKEWLSDFRSASDLGSFSTTPVYEVQAYYTAAWWMAVAARVLQDLDLAEDAGKLAAKGTAVFALPGSSLLKGDTPDILKEGAAAIRAAASGSPTTVARQARGIATRLKTMASSGSQKTARESEGAQDVLLETGKKTGDDTKKGLLDLLPKPPGLPEIPWGWIIAGTVVTVGGFWLVRSRRHKKLLAAVKGLTGAPQKPKQIEAKPAEHKEAA